jgi:mannose-6-phosphate isomerase-like protein (cupin superfamily)
MNEINRRSALTLGTAIAAATPLLVLARSAAAAEIVPTYGPNDGTELSPGVRLIEVGTFDSDMTMAKKIQIIDIVYQPGAADIESAMDNDMVCFVTAGEFKVKKSDKEFTVKKGEYYTCGKGKTDQATNISKEVGIHRITVLVPG